MLSARPRNRSHRLDLVMRVLSDRPGITTGDLAREFGVSARSIFRDLDELRERGVLVEASRGRGGGLRLPTNWGLGKVLLSREEALCTLLSLAIAEKLALPMFTADVFRARRKITGAFPRSEQRKIAPLRERIFVRSPASQAVKKSYTEPAAVPMRRLQAAFVDERIVRVEYVKESGERSIRRLEPHAIVINWPAWYLLAHDHSRDEPRTFRLDRFVVVDIERDGFRPRAQAIVQMLLRSNGVVVDRV